MSITINVDPKFKSTKIISISKQSRNNSEKYTNPQEDLEKYTNPQEASEKYTNPQEDLEKYTNQEEDLEKYINQKTSSVYIFPMKSKYKVMKGMFFNKDKTYKVDPSGWWVSEKLDGIRAIWTGRVLLTRSGKVISGVPEWFLAQLPSEIALDGELYLGRNRFREVQSIVMDSNSSDHFWQKITYHVFDIPDSNNLDFELVQRILNSHINNTLSNVKVVEQQIIPNLQWLLQFQKEIVSNLGEGTMIRRPKSRYILGDSSDLLKFKTNFVDGKMVDLLDDEAVIVGYKYNLEKMNKKGKPSIKSVKCRWLDIDKFDKNPEFTVSHHITKDQKMGDYYDIFPIGSIIKVLYNQLFDHSQKPRFPRYGGILDTSR